MAASGSLLKIEMIRRRPNLIYKETLVPAIPKIIYKTINKDPRVRVHARINPNVSHTCINCGRPLAYLITLIVTSVVCVEYTYCIIPQNAYVTIQK